MKSYPSIQSSRDRTIPLGENCLVFYKYDGSNLRWEWSKKKGWHKFGTRHRLFGPEEAPYNQAISIFMNEVGPVVEEVIRHEFKGCDEIVAFTEFFGPSSFAGSHDLDEQKMLKLFDVSVYKRGIIPPRQFHKLFNKHDFTAKLLLEGKLNKQLIEDVRSSKIAGLDEGVVCKGADHRGQVWMVKIKTEEYLAKLRSNFGSSWEKYAE